MTTDEAGNTAVVSDALQEAVDSHGVETVPEITVIDEGHGSSCSSDQEVAAPLILHPSDLEHLTQILSDVVKRLDDVEQAVALRDKGDGRDVVRDAGHEFAQGAVDLPRMTTDVVGQAVRARKRQKSWGVFVAGAIAGVALGIALVLFATRMLPAPLETTIASTVMGERWRHIVELEKFQGDHKAKLSLCATEAARTMQDQVCMLLIHAPKP